MIKTIMETLRGIFLKIFINLDCNLALLNEIFNNNQQPRGSINRYSKVMRMLSVQVYFEIKDRAMSKVIDSGRCGIIVSHCVGRYIIPESFDTSINTQSYCKGFRSQSRMVWSGEHTHITKEKRELHTKLNFTNEH